MGSLLSKEEYGISSEEFEKLVELFNELNNKLQMITTEKEKIQLKVREIDFTKMKELGEGHFGKVFLDESVGEETEVIKVLKIPEEKKDHKKQIKTGIINEFYVNRVMRDDNIILAKDYFISD